MDTVLEVLGRRVGAEPERYRQPTAGRPLEGPAVRWPIVRRFHADHPGIALPTSPAPTSATRRRRTFLVLGLLVLAALAVGATMALGGSDDDVAFEGPDDDLINAEALEQLSFEVTAERAETLAEATVELDGEDVTEDAELADSALVYAPRELGDGEHEVEISVPSRVGSQSERWSFTVDATPPELEVASPEGAVVFLNQETVVAGTTDPDATLTVDGEEVEVGEDGSFEVTYDEPPSESLTIVAVDEAGNETVDERELTVLRSRVEVDEVRAVHVTGNAWNHDGLRGQVMEMIEDGKINSVQLDIKGESGRIYNNTDVELANEMGASFGFYDLEDVVDELHDMGVHVIGRVVAFNDPHLGEYAQGNGDMEWLVQTPDGEPYTAGYGCCFTSFANDEVLDYNIGLAIEAAQAGVDGILWDYVRRPDGDPDAMVYDGLADDAGGSTLEQAVVDFVARADEALEPYHVEHGASVYGIAATRPTQIAQDIEGMSQHLDYVAPMLYPSHWGPGEYDVANPVQQPYDIIHASLDEFLEITEASGRARVVPWLEDSNYPVSLGVADRGQYVRDQIRAALDRDVNEWIMWDSHVNYTVDAYEVHDD